MRVWFWYISTMTNGQFALAAVAINVACILFWSGKRRTFTFCLADFEGGRYQQKLVRGCLLLGSGLLVIMISPVVEMLNDRLFPVTLGIQAAGAFLLWRSMKFLETRAK